MTTHTSRLRATSIATATTTAVATALVLGAAPAAVAQSPPAAVRQAPSPSPDPFKGLSADQIADRAVTATQSATSLRMAGRVVSDDQPLDVDFSLNDKNECTGAIKLKGGAAELRQTGRVTYMKGDEAFWRASMSAQRMPPSQIDATIELLKGRWLKIPQGQPGTEDLSDVCDLKALLDDLGKDKERRTGLTRGPDAEVDGTSVATLVKKKADTRTDTGPDADRDTPETTTVSVSEEGKPYILKVVKTGGDEPGSVTLSEYDKPVKVVVPPADETVDLSKLDRGTPA